MFSINYLHINYRIYTQEVLVAIALLCDSTWNKRAGLLFNIFKCIGIEEMGHEDFILAAQIVAVSLCRIWCTANWDQSTLSTLSETIADNAFTKVLILLSFYFLILIF